MKVIASSYMEKINEFEVLSEEAMNEVRGGSTPRSRDKDIYEFEE